MHKDVETDEEQTEGESGDDPLPYFDMSTRAKYDQVVERLEKSSSTKQQPQQLAAPKGPQDASVQLARFLPGDGIDRLRMLLGARADPNVEPAPGRMSPLSTVRIFARADLHKMRELLLQYGAKETEAERAAWGRRLRSDRHDPVWCKNFHKDDRVG